MNATNTTQRRSGRPALPPEAGKRHAVGLRTTKALKDSLEVAAGASGRSVAQEVEVRLEKSFERDEFIKLLFGAPYFVDFFQKMAEVARRIEQKTGKPGEDTATRLAIRAAWVELIGRYWWNHGLVDAIRASANVPALEEPPDTRPKFDVDVKGLGEIVRQVFEEDEAKMSARIGDLARRMGAITAEMRSIYDKLDLPRKD
jgi:hypothetical protein